MAKGRSEDKSLAVESQEKSSIKSREITNPEDNALTYLFRFKIYLAFPQQRWETPAKIQNLKTNPISRLRDRNLAGNTVWKDFSS